MIRINGRPYGWSTDLAALQIPSRHCAGLHYEHKTAERLDRDEPRESRVTLAKAALECAFVATLPDRLSDAAYAVRMREFDVTCLLYRLHGKSALTGAQAVEAIDRLDERRKKSKGAYQDRDRVNVDALVTHGLLRWTGSGRLKVTDAMAAMFAAYRIAVKGDGEN